MNILEKIVLHKKKEVAERKSRFPVSMLEKTNYFQAPALSLKEFLTRPDKLGIIAEFKRKSPSKPSINLSAEVEKVTKSYVKAGASALSILTDQDFFGGSLADLKEARKANFCPILRKDFIIDEYQLIEAKSAGADAVLLIAECLEKASLKKLAIMAHDLGLEVLMEIHDSVGLEKLNEHIDVLGVNNRDLRVFKTDIQNSVNLATDIPDGQVKISESGIKTAEDIVTLLKAGFDGFLIGEQFMKNEDPGLACSELIHQVHPQEN